MPRKPLSHCRVILFLSASLACSVAPAQTKDATRPFTVADDIGLVRFGGSWTAIEDKVLFSPDGKHFAAETERGRSDLNEVQDCLRFYRTQDVEHFLENVDERAPPSPEWIVSRFGKEGAVINAWRWSADSSGVAFLEGGSFLGNQRIVLAELKDRTVSVLTPKLESIKAFDLHDRRHYVYSVDERMDQKARQVERAKAAFGGTGHSLFELLFPQDPITNYLAPYTKALWVADGERPFQVRSNSAPIEVIGGDLALSPDGGSVVTSMSVTEVPATWETLYPAPFGSEAYRIRRGHYDIKSSRVHQYVLIDVHSGSVQTLTDAPTSSDAGWWALGRPVWSSDGQAILLPGTFIRTKNDMPSRPCVAVVDLPSRSSTCVEMLKGHTEGGLEAGYHTVTGAHFVDGDKQRITVNFHSHEEWALEAATEYHRMTDGTWGVVGETENRDARVSYKDLDVAIHQSMSEPPVLVATSKGISRVLWDPNPQLGRIKLGEVRVFEWKDSEGKQRKGGLYKPVNYRAGVRYPLVVQTHGFDESAFLPSGLFTTAFAARELAAHGIMVLQVGEVGDCQISTPSEGSCNVAGFQTVINQLVGEGLIDPNRIGIIGFSRTCFHVMEMLTAGSMSLTAASITDGVMETYLQFLMQINRGNEGAEEEAIIGAPPFGGGLQRWFQFSPGFKLDRIKTPLLVAAGGPVNVLFMWEPYAALRYLQSPVDLMVLNTDEHVLTNPAVRMASQGTSVDWFRFWLKGEEESVPEKAEQYRRWERLCDMQKRENHDRPSFCVGTRQ
jgi:dipeptidyl aminopeptidase/acylaminoacyl peptidase